MALQKQNITLPFKSGLDTKTDQYQVQPPKVELLENAVFTEGMSIHKRFGYSAFSTSIAAPITFTATTLSGSNVLTAVSSNILLYTGQFLSNATDLTPGTKIESINVNANTITISFPAIASGTAQTISALNPSIGLALGGASYQNEAILFDGLTIYSYNQTGLNWTPKGTAQSVSLSVESIVRDTVQQTTQDSAFHTSGYYCYVWESSDGTSRYSIIDSNTDQTVVSSISLGTVAVQPKVNVLGNYFLISYIDSSTSHLRQISIPITTPSVPSAPIDIATTVNTTPSERNYDATVINNSVYFAWNNNTTNVSFCFINPFLVQSATSTVIGANANTGLTIFGDVTNNFVWCAVVDGITTGTEVLYSIQNIGLTATVLGWTTVETVANTRNITASVLGVTATFYYEISNVIAYNTLVRTNTGTLIGTVGTPTVFLRSVGLWAKCFQYLGIVYLGVTYQSQLQPLYYIVNSSGIVITKIAYQNAGGLTLKVILPQINMINSTSFEVAYLIKDLLEAESGNIYTQTGLNGAFINFADLNNFGSVTLGNDLHISGGILSMYDGISVVEHGFFVFPETVTLIIPPFPPAGGIGWGVLTSQPSWQYSATYEWTDNQGNNHQSAPSIPLTVMFPMGGAVTFTATTSATSTPTILRSVSSFTGLFVGQVITNVTDLQTNTTIVSLDIAGSTITMSLPAIASGTAQTITTHDTDSSVINVDTLRITRKISPRTPVSIVLYRTVANGTTFFRVSSITAPTYNDTTVDSVQFLDTTPDAALIGNELLYTTGGVLENICAPATNILTTYNNRVILVVAEDPNLLWYSQVTDEGIPVSFNDSLTEFIDPRGGFITSIFTMDDKLIIFKTNSLFYFAGLGPNSEGLQNDFSTPFLVTTDCGCTNQNSIVTMPSGLMFQSPKGIYLLDRGLNSRYVGAEVEAFNNLTITASILVPNTNQVRFVTTSGISLMYDYYYQQWGTFTNQFASDAIIFQDLFTYFGTDGVVFQESIGNFTDNGAFVPLRVRTSWLQLAGLQGYQRCYKVYILGTFKSPHTLQVSIANNFNPGATQVVYANATALFGGGNVFGDGNVYGSNGTFGGPAPTEQWRLDLVQQKTQSFQITIQDVQTAPFGEGLSLSGLTIIAGVKVGLNKVAPGQIIS